MAHEQRTPTRHRRTWALGALALLGSAGYLAIVLAPFLALAMLANALWFHQSWVYGVLGMLVLGAWWLMQGSEPPEGQEITRCEATAMWAALDELADRMRVQRLRRVVLIDEPSAAAIEHQDRWRPWRRHRTLALGLPLLTTLSVVEMQAVVAHEMGHFSRHFGWAGHWLYRARLGWTQLAYGREADTLWLRMAGGFARWFVPLFERQTHAAAVRAEYEADALAATATSADALGRALARLAAAAAQEAPTFGAGPLPTEPWSLATPGLGRAVDAHTLAEALRSDTEKHAEHDQAELTHPPAVARLQALGLPLNAWSLPPVLPAAVVGPLWWGEEDWERRMGIESARWQALHARSWLAEAQWRDACIQRLDEIEPIRPEDALECALTLGRPVPPLREDERPDTVSALHGYWRGVACLANDADEARRWLRAAVQSCVALAAPARLRMLGPTGAAGTPAAAVGAIAVAESGLAVDTNERSHRLLAAARERRAEARARADAQGLEAGRVVVADGWRLAALQQALADDPAVRRAAWVQHEVVQGGDRHYPVVSLCLQIDADSRISESELAQAYGPLLARVITPARVGQVCTWWSAQAWPEALSSRAEELDLVR